MIKTIEIAPDIVVPLLAKFLHENDWKFAGTTGEHDEYLLVDLDKLKPLLTEFFKTYD
jgi:hypothetical protein